MLSGEDWAKIQRLRQADLGVVAGLSAYAGGDDCRADRVVVFDSVPVGTGGGVATGGSATQSSRARDVCGRRDRAVRIRSHDTNFEQTPGPTKCGETQNVHDIFYLVIA